jgi:transcription termination factor NusB
LDVSFVDQYGQKRTIKNVEFESDKKKTLIPKSLQVEAIYQLEHDIEKKVAAVLKDEINRYKKYGRRSGELGSIYAIYNGRKIKSIYQDGWTNSKSGERQEIVADPENSHVYSENGDALTSYYNEIIDDAEKELFINSLISRLNREKEYYCVSYLILYVLFRIGRLNDGLVAAEFGLQNKQSFLDRILRRRPKNELLEVHQRYGFSDSLGLINGLLRYEHHSFTDIDLDLLEEFIDNVEEHTFRIEEKINSTRSFRLNQ